ncbi:MAG: HlyD family secretion protein [Myxococcota bacterium]|jgi:HlyD family secretion protein
MSQRKIQAITRAEAQEHLSSTEQLDQAMVVVKGRAWILLAVIVAILAAALYWGFVGRIPREIDGVGITSRGTLPVSIENPDITGAVLSVAVKAGEILEAGATIATIGSPRATQAIVQAQANVDSLIEANRISAAAETSVLAKLTASTKLQTDTANRSLTSNKILIVLYEKQVENSKTLSDKKLIPKSQLISDQSTLFQAQELKLRLVATISQLEATLQQSQTQIDSSRSSRQSAIATAKAKLATTRQAKDANEKIVAPMRCEVLAILVQKGQFVTPGEPLGTVISMSKSTGLTRRAADHVIGFIPFAKGVEVEPGMAVEIALPFASSTQYGFIKGTVRSVATYAASESSITGVLGNSSLKGVVTSKTGGVALQVIIDLKADENTASGLAWTSRKGFPSALPRMSECDLKIFTREDTPIELILPWFKQLLGIDTVSAFDSGTASSG